LDNIANNNGTRIYEALESAADELYVKALKTIPDDVVKALKGANERETNPPAKRILTSIVENINKATELDTLVCQDTGIPVYYVKVGTGMDINVARLSAAITKGCARATKENNLRPNLVHPFTRINTGTNTGTGMPVIDLDSCREADDYIEITALPKGSGSENCSVLSMLTPADGIVGVKRFILESVVQAGGKACPPLIVGVGVGGDFDSVARLAKRAVFRPIGAGNADAQLQQLEGELFTAINRLGIGPMGLGGNSTALAVNIEYAHTHISCLPVALNTQCWRGERASARVYADGGVEYLA
jgi:fumarate hydratase subunit alpha